MKIKADIEIVTGFLGAGKTSFINMLIGKTLVTGEKVVIIQNEEGNTGLSVALDTKYKVITKELEPSKDITAPYLERLIAFYNPHRIIIECNGMKALGNLLREVEELILKETCREPVIYSLIDAAAFDIFFSNMRELMQPSISHGNLIIVNNSSLFGKENKEQLLEKLENINREAIIIAAKDTEELSLILDKKEILSNGLIKKLRIRLLNRFRRM